MMCFGQINLGRTVSLAGMLAALALLGSGMSYAQDKITLKLNQAQVLQLPPHTSVVVLGNPAIADVTLIKRAGSMILTGKSFGRTNLLALDNTGHTLGESTVAVVASNDSMIVQLGAGRQTYDCDPNCQPTFGLGDESKFTTMLEKEITARNGLANPK